MNKYKKNWKKLKKQIKADLKMYQTDNTVSISESIHGEQICEIVLGYMKDIEYESKKS